MVALLTPSLLFPSLLDCLESATRSQRDPCSHVTLRLHSLWGSTTIYKPSRGSSTIPTRTTACTIDGTSFLTRAGIAKAPTTCPRTRWYLDYTNRIHRPTALLQGSRQAADLAQLERQSQLCLFRAEPDVRIKGELGSPRGPSAYANYHASSNTTRAPISNVDITTILKGPSDSNEPLGRPPRHHRPTSVPVPLPTPSLATSGLQPPYVATPVAEGSMPGGRRSMPPQGPEQPVKKQSKWTPDEDALIIELRGSGMKWEDISKRLPGRSAISCRLHYQNYLERRSEWDEERKNKLARLYER
jgi:hypothetical protein